ncbi:type II toxin-antitoxin system RelE/ParE family toxin [Rhizobium halophytocola]|uniref:Plasmid stabilization system protein ParE n=1 Tax=Rhizobium halophytocola TaxID=735519 RepID=A0ABS4DYL0_9HYPH|nr:type II toxin-antitoxin system RelE/ParE family toxin [Rhizobium halophytocola]MBP1850776.1 plasmid stabilization system protein ParE [Rhizobium halophytocola]
MDALTGFPGVPRDGLSTGRKALPYRRRCIYFRTTETRGTILRIFHGAHNVSPQDFQQND